MKGVSVLIIFVVLHVSTHAQDQSAFFFNGYVKDMVTANFPENSDSILLDNLIHNRLNFRWEPSKKISARLELRNRIFTGDVVQAIPNYSEFIDVNDDYFDWSLLAIDQNTMVFHTMIDRLSLTYSGDDWNITMGRQRINWGINLAWNPNDIFNAYSFFDFDYEERPGSDAIRFQKFIGFADGYEVAVKLADSWEEITAAALYKKNISGYDIQTLVGIMQNNFVLGAGWAGNLKTAGFKGEVSFFEPLEKEHASELIASLSLDYSFPGSLYLNGSVLYSSYQNNSVASFAELTTSNLDVRSISPFSWSALLQATYAFHPLINGGAAIIYFPGEAGIFLNPSLSWSIKANLDLDLIGQFYVNAHPQETWATFLRIKHSF